MLDVKGYKMYVALDDTEVDAQGVPIVLTFGVFDPKTGIKQDGIASPRPELFLWAYRRLAVREKGLREGLVTERDLLDAGRVSGNNFNEVCYAYFPRKAVIGCTLAGMSDPHVLDCYGIRRELSPSELEEARQGFLMVFGSGAELAKSFTDFSEKELRRAAEPEPEPEPEVAQTQAPEPEPAQEPVAQPASRPKPEPAAARSEEKASPSFSSYTPYSGSSSTRKFVSPHKHRGLKMFGLLCLLFLIIVGPFIVLNLITGWDFNKDVLVIIGILVLIGISTTPVVISI